MQIPVVESPTKLVMEKKEEQKQQLEANHPKDDFWGEDGFDFFDLLDVVNPLQHIPIVNSAYRAVTGDEISSGASMIGGTLFGGFVGMIGSALNNFSIEDTGEDIATNVAQAMFGKDETPVQFAKAKTEPLPASPEDTVQALAPLTSIQVAALEPTTKPTHTTKQAAMPSLAWLKDQSDKQAHTTIPGLDANSLPASLSASNGTPVQQAAKTYQSQDLALKALEQLADIKS